MKHIFIINPKSGKTDNLAEIKEQLKTFDGKIDYEIYSTKAPKDATRYIKEYCEKNPEEVRFYACGGDGTLNEVVTGAMGFPQAQISCYPCGSGNDFVKYYGGADKFLNIANTVNGEEHKIDVMSICGGKYYSVNICNFGFDSVVCNTMINVRRKPVIGGRNAYTTGIINGLVRGMKHTAAMKCDGESFYAGDFLLCTLGNGSHVGGSFNCSPRSSNEDGLIEVCLVKRLTHLQFIKLLTPYQNGKHLDDPMFRDFILYRRTKTFELTANGDFWVSLDGEMVNLPHFTIENLQGAIRFVAPKS